jgi:N-acetyl-anhydromuramyl-L-alanine amidase AmpD
MNDWDDSNESEGMKNMRKQLKEQAKLLKEQSDLIAQFQVQNRGSVIAQALVSRGLDAKVAKFYPADLGTDDESVDKWYNENKDIFGPAQPVATPQSQETTLSELERRGYEAMQGMEAYDARVVQDFKSQMDQIKMDGPYDGERAANELIALLQSNGVNINSM